MIRTWHEFYPKETPLEIEIPLLSLYDLLENSAQQYPTNKAVIDGEKELTYLELKNASDRFVKWIYTIEGFKRTIV